MFPQVAFPSMHTMCRHGMQQCIQNRLRSTQYTALYIKKHLTIHISLAYPRKGHGISSKHITQQLAENNTENDSDHIKLYICFSDT